MRDKPLYCTLEADRIQDSAASKGDDGLMTD